MSTPVDIAPARGKLGVLLVGLGAVSTTTIAGVLAIRKGISKPIGSLTQMGTIRLGKRTEGRSPKISEVVPLTPLDDIVFGGWDIFAEDCYAAALTAGVIEPALLDQVRPELEQIKPWPAGRAEKLPGGWGVMLDDVAAGAWGAAVLVAARAAGWL